MGGSCQGRPRVGTRPSLLRLGAWVWSLRCLTRLLSSPRLKVWEPGPDPPCKAPPAPGRLPNCGRSVSKSGWHQGQWGQARRPGVSQRAGVQSLPRGCDAAIGSGWQRGGGELAWTLPTAGISGRTWSFLPDSFLSFIEIGREEPEWAGRKVDQGLSAQREAGRPGAHSRAAVVEPGVSIPAAQSRAVLQPGAAGSQGPPRWARDAGPVPRVGVNV